MPKIQVYEKTFHEYLGWKPTDTELAAALERIKGELEEHGDGVLKIELKDTNRPDLWSSPGLARQIRALRGTLPADYAWGEDAADRVVTVDPGLRDIRPYIAALAVRGKKLTETMLLDLIETQEVLCRNFGRKRKSIAMGVHREALIRWPLRYRASSPRGASFVPLQMTEELTLEEILTKHPKGQEYGWILKDFEAYPLLEDASGGVLSFPPVINSARIGGVAVGDDRLFVDLTGTDLDILLTALNIVAADFRDMGFEILPVKVSYPYDTKYGRDVLTPRRFQTPVACTLSYAGRLLGVEMDAKEAVACLRTAGVRTTVSGQTITATPPIYRNDFLHAADVVEEIMIGRGMATFEPVWPREFTIGRLSPQERFSRRVVDILVGLGYQEMIYLYLGSTANLVQRMRRDPETTPLVRIANPISESAEAVQDSILPNLLSTEAASGNAVYPHRIFEVGRTCHLAPEENLGTRTQVTLAMLVSSREAGFNDIRAHVAAVFFYLGREYTLSALEDRRFIPGRAASVLDPRTREILGVMGEMHPEVLSAFRAPMPCAVAELDLEGMMGVEGR